LGKTPQSLVNGVFCRLSRSSLTKGSGAKGREQPPAFDALWKVAIRKEFDVVMVWAVDRLAGRSHTSSISCLRFTRRRLTYSFTSKGSTRPRRPARRSSGDGRLCGVRTVDDSRRVRSGIKRVRAAGQRWGRRSIEETDPASCTRMLELRRQGLGMAAIGKRVGVSSRTVWRFLRGVQTASQVA